jgi:flagellar hook protein FlgE
MSLYGALLTGVSGLDANGRALTITSSNIANVNTVGFKTSTADFSTFLAATGQADPTSPTSVQVNGAQDLTQQGLLTTTTSPTDLAISGNGFFIVTDNLANPATSQFYTRAGSFLPDASGLLKNAAGLYLEGWTLDSAGNMPANRSTLAPINLGTLTGAAQQTSNVTLKANLQASATAVAAYNPGDMTSGAVTPQFQQTINVYDSQGGTRAFQLSFVKTAANTWAYEIAYQGAAADIGGAGNNPVNTGTLTFNADGTLASPATAAFNIPWDPSTGLVPQPMTLNFGTVGQSDGVTQFDSSSVLTSANMDGAPFGALSSVSVDNQGYVTALYDNGIQKKVFKVALATFANADGLAPVAGNAYQVTEASGAPTISEPKTGGAGQINSDALEASTSDLAQEFSDLITTQRAYDAASKIVTTADQMLQVLVQIKQ